MTVQELQERMSVSEYIQWVCYFKVKNYRAEQERVAAMSKQKK